MLFIHKYYTTNTSTHKSISDSAVLFIHLLNMLSVLQEQPASYIVDIHLLRNLTTLQAISNSGGQWKWWTCLAPWYRFTRTSAGSKPAAYLVWTRPSLRVTPQPRSDPVLRRLLSRLLYSTSYSQPRAISWSGRVSILQRSLDVWICYKTLYLPHLWESTTCETL